VERDPRADHIVVHVLTDADPASDPADTDPTEGPDGDLPEVPPSTTVIAGGGVIPAALLTRLLAMRVAVRYLASGTTLPAEPGYRPSAALARFVRARDMTCRFPGCDHPAEYCDLDHTIPFGSGGPTHPSNLKTLCRKHHLLKTFWVGRGGWTDRQDPDGTVTWTSPARLRYQVPPASRLYFPDWNTRTPMPDATLGSTSDTGTGRGLAMPTRTITRARQYDQAILAERQRNRRVADENPAPF
jgi:hypothetical protein